MYLEYLRIYLKVLAKLFRGFVNIINKEFNRIEARKIANIEFEAKLEEARGSRSQVLIEVMKERDEYMQMKYLIDYNNKMLLYLLLDLLKPITDKFKSKC